MKIKKPIRVILADDHAIVRRGIRRILEKASNICVIAETGTGAGALRLVQELEPDVLVLDIEMPDMQGIHVARELRTNHVPVSIVILSAFDDNYFIEEVLQVGVDRYLHKSESLAKIREVIHQVSQKYIPAIVLLFAVSLPRVGWIFYQAFASASGLPSD